MLNHMLVNLLNQLCVHFDSYANVAKGRLKTVLMSDCKTCNILFPNHHDVAVRTLKNITQNT